MGKNAFSGYHPFVQLFFFSSVMLMTMMGNQPVLLLLSFAASLVYSLYLARKKALRAMLTWILPAFVGIAVINPLFNHAGMTILFYLPDGNPFTEESLVYGLAAGGMFSTILMWCLCLRYTIRSDGVLYLFGRFTPHLGLLLSMILRFVPEFSAQFRRVRGAQKCLGRDISQGGWLQRFRNGVRILSSVIGWAMEHSVETADSLRSRGYGLGRRTSFSLIRFEKRDAAALIWILLTATTALAALTGTEWVEFFYFPAMTPLEWTVQAGLVYLDAALLCWMPAVIDWREDRIWKSLRSVS